MHLMTAQNILKGMLTLPLSLYRGVGSSFDHACNWASIRYKKVTYGSFPVIKGRIRLYGEGAFVFGKDLKFNCSVGSNYVGLYKTCTVAVLPNARLEIGDCSGFSGVSIYCSEQISIGSHVNCGGNVCIWDTDFHPLDYQERRVHNTEKIFSAPIAIGDDVFIGANSIVLKGVSIGDRSIIGAGSVVSRNIPPDEIWAGNPIKFIKSIHAEG